MENHTNRTLAYVLAKPLQDTEQDTISGGMLGLSAHQTLKITGDSSQGPEMNYDVSVDM